jgi:hypothetical protein
MNGTSAAPPPFITAKATSLGKCPSCGRAVEALQSADFAALTHELPPCDLFESLPADEFVRQMRQRQTGKMGRA